MTKNAEIAPLTAPEAAQLLAIAAQGNVDALLREDGQSLAEPWPLAEIVAEAQKPGPRYAGARTLARRLATRLAGPCECGQPLDHEPGECPAIPTPEMEIEIWDEMLCDAARRFAREQRNAIAFVELAEAAANYATCLARVTDHPLANEQWGSIMAQIRARHPTEK